MPDPSAPPLPPQTCPRQTCPRQTCPPQTCPPLTLRITGYQAHTLLIAGRPLRVDIPLVAIALPDPDRAAA